MLPSIVKCQTIIVAGVLDVAGTYGLAVLLLKLLAGYTKFSIYQGIVVLHHSAGFNKGCLRRLLSQTAGCWCHYHY